MDQLRSVAEHVAEDEPGGQSDEQNKEPEEEGGAQSGQEVDDVPHGQTVAFCRCGRAGRCAGRRVLTVPRNRAAQVIGTQSSM